ncbi:hypothetical protein BDR04DRAFT_1091390 [Suillus decipiens]|nr:hypothetical protein BDR04DRAFT_1091390 [Suillus decipiens]
MRMICFWHLTESDNARRQIIHDSDQIAQIDFTSVTHLLDESLVQMMGKRTRYLLRIVLVLLGLYVFQEEALQVDTRPSEV